MTPQQRKESRFMTDEESHKLSATIGSLSECIDVIKATASMLHDLGCPETAKDLRDLHWRAINTRNWALNGGQEEA
jgi:hypothetical protein